LPVTFLIGKIAIGKLYDLQVKIKHSFFDGLVPDYATQPKLDEPKPVIPLPELSLPFNLDYLSFPVPAQLKIKSLGNNNSQEPQLLYHLLKRVFDEYLFYSEAGIDKERAIAGFDRLFKERLLCSTSIDCQLANDISAYLEDTFQDPHFGIGETSSCKNFKKSHLVRGPVHLYEIERKIMVAAVLDTAYAKDIPLGTELATINGLDARQIVDSLQQDVGPWRRRSDIVSDLLKAGREDSVILGFKHADKGVAIKYDGKIKIPENFQIQHCQYRAYENSIAYFRVRQWDFKVYFEFIKRWSALDRSNSLVIDLRKNGGGEFLSALRMLTLFVDKPTTLYKTKFSNNSYESLVIAPNPFFHFPRDRRIVILIDARTACTSEMFLLGMKNLPNVTIMGSDRTFGTDASRYDITFPSGFKIYINCISKVNVYGDDFIVENKGINPDIWVHLNNVSDLEPYNDKVLQSAIRLLR
jgi:hypothetical protein